MAKRSKKVEPVNIRASIKSAFEASGMSQAEFSRRAGTTPAKICEFLKDDGTGTQPRMESLERMMNVLGLEVRAGR